MRVARKEIAGNYVIVNYFEKEHVANPTAVNFLHREENISII